MNYDYKIAPNIVNLAVARPSMAVGRGTGGGLSPPVPLQTTPTNPGANSPCIEAARSVVSLSDDFQSNERQFPSSPTNPRSELIHDSTIEVIQIAGCEGKQQQLIRNSEISCCLFPLSVSIDWALLVWPLILSIESLQLWTSIRILTLVFSSLLDLQSLHPPHI